MKKIIILLMGLMLLSCNKEVSKPKNLMSKEKFREVVKDVYLYKQLGSIYPNRQVEELVEINNAILYKHGVSVDEFESSFKYYVIDGASYGSFLEDIKKEIINEKNQISKVGK